MGEAFLMGQGGGGGLGVKRQEVSGSIAYGNIIGAVTISAVDITKSVVKVSAWTDTADNNAGQCACMAYFNSATQVYVERVGNTGIIYFTVEVLEFTGAKAVYTNACGIGVSSTDVADVLPASVDTTKCLTFFSFKSSAVSVYKAGCMLVKCRLTSSSIIFTTIYAPSASYVTVRWYVVELY